MNLVLQIKSKMWSVRACERKIRVFYLYHLFCQKQFFLTFVLSQCIVYWIHFRNIHTFTYQKPLLQTLFCWFLKSFTAFGVFLKTLVANKSAKISAISWIIVIGILDFSEALFSFRFFIIFSLSSSWKANFGFLDFLIFLLSQWYSDYLFVWLSVMIVCYVPLI